jgi:hypothetical protein
MLPPLTRPATKLLIAVATCEKPKFVEKADAQKATWARLRPDVDIRFFTGPTLGVDDSYPGLPAKVRAIFRWALERDYSHVFKTDDDTWLNVDALLAGVPTSHYHGCVRDGNGGYPAPYPSGFGYWLDRVAMEVIANAELTQDTMEDRWVGNTLDKAWIRPTTDPLNYRCIYPGIGDPRLIWSWHSRIGHACCFAQFPAEMIRKTHAAFEELYPAYCKMHPKE